MVAEVDGGEAPEAGRQPQAGSLVVLDARVDERDAFVVLLDADDRYVAPAIPVDGCGKPLGWGDRDRDRLAWLTLPYTDRVVR